MEADERLSDVWCNYVKIKSRQQLYTVERDAAK